MNRASTYATPRNPHRKGWPYLPGLAAYAVLYALKVLIDGRGPRR